MQLGIHTLQISNCDLPLQDHLVADKVDIQESPMEDTQAKATTEKLEMVQMVWVDTRGSIDLEGITIMGGRFEETVERIDHLM